MKKGAPLTSKRFPKTKNRLICWHECITQHNMLHGMDAAYTLKVKKCHTYCGRVSKIHFNYLQIPGNFTVVELASR